MGTPFQLEPATEGTTFQGSLLDILESGQSLSEIFHGLVESLGLRISFDRAVLLRSLPSGGMKIVHQYPALLGAESIVSPGAECMEILRRGKAAVVSDVLLNPWGAEDIRSCLLAPIQTRRQTQGVFALGSRRSDAFEQSQIEPAQAAAHILGVMMSHQALVEELKATSARRALELEEAAKSTATLLEVSGILLSVDRQRALEQVAACVSRRPELAPRVEELVALWRANPSAAELERVNTELARTLEDLQTSRAQLQRAEKLAAVGSLVAGAAHELNNPLAVILGYAEILMSHRLPAPLQERLAMIHEQARRASQIVSGLLQLSRVSYAVEGTGGAADSCASQTCDLVDALHEAVAARAESLSRQNILLAVDAETNLFIAAKPADVRQVIMHLLENAEYAVQQGGRGVKNIQVTLSRQAGYAELVVADSGPGIPSDVLPRIFDPFFTTKPTGFGAGLGLSICYGIVTSTGGSIQAANQEEGGAVFTLSWPALPDSDNPKSLGRTVLVLAADEPVRALWQETLEQTRCEPATVATKAELLETLARVPVDLVIADLSQPHHEGLKLSSELRHRGLTIPLLLVAGEGLEPAARETIVGAGLPILDKPFRLNELRQAMDRALGRLNAQP